jgi:beta-phosphoglucomutase-like phosphatase (HAD superfamily)
MTASVVPRGTAASVARRSSAREPTPARRSRIELDTVAARWQLALDAAQQGLASAPASLPAAEVAHQRGLLVHEREETAALLARVARETGARATPWLSPVPVTPTLLGLSGDVQACLFDLDGVLTDSGVLHARAWAEVFDDLLFRLAEKTGWHFIPFDRDRDYAAYLDGRARLEGIHAFLTSRGISLPEGRPGDPPTAETAQGLARHKSDVMARSLGERSVVALPGARRYLEAAGRAGLRRAVISASDSTARMLEDARLGTVVDSYVDGETMRREALRSLPAPDVVVMMCRRLEVDPGDVVAFTRSRAGVAAARAAGVAVVGVAADPRAQLLEGFGAARCVPSLDVLLDHRLRSQPGRGARSRPTA